MIKQTVSIIKVAVIALIISSGPSLALAQTLPVGTSGQTLRHDGTDWTVSSLIFNDGTNVGIGMTAPAFKLDINNPSGTSRTGLHLGYNGLNDLFLTDNGASVSSNLYHSGGWKYNATNAGAIFGMANGSLSFYTAPSGTAGTAATLTNAMQITNAGNVGIGTTAPATKLAVVGSLGVTEGSISARGPLGGHGRVTMLLDGSDQFEWYPQATGLHLYDRGVNGGGGGNAGYKLSILNNGNVGIGTTVPAAKLNVVGGAIVSGDVSAGTIHSGAITSTAGISATGLTTTGAVSANSVTTNAISATTVSASSLSTSGAINSHGLGVTGNANVTGNVTASGIVTASQICIGTECRTSFPIPAGSIPQYYQCPTLGSSCAQTYPCSGFNGGKSAVNQCYSSMANGSQWCTGCGCYTSVQNTCYPVY
ncbi:MAG: hypothetical protein WC791_02080 [Candidatus Paceibacterota bacterium]|jgi:hypothetical protein